MRISFSGWDHPVHVGEGAVTVLQICNSTLFARVCQSLLSGECENAIEPYSLWDEAGNEIKASGAFFPIVNPFALPWKHPRLIAALYGKLDRLLLEDEELREELQTLNGRINAAVCKLGFQLHGDYGFAVEWEMRNYLKAFGYGSRDSRSASLFENLIDFIDFWADMAIDEVFLFVNLKTFLSENELMELYERLIFYKIKTLLLENHESKVHSDIEQKMVVDQHFIEYRATSLADCPSPTQGRICSNGFGAVTI